MTNRNDAIVRALRPMKDELSGISMQWLPKIRAETDYVAWCDCHPNWHTQVSVTDEAARLAAPNPDLAELAGFAIAREMVTREHCVQTTVSVIPLDPNKT